MNHEPRTMSQDQITDILLALHKGHGMRAVKQALRCAVINFAAEYTPHDSPLGSVNHEVVEEIADAIRTPAHAQ